MISFFTLSLFISCFSLCMPSATAGWFFKFTVRHLSDTYENMHEWLSEHTRMQKYTHIHMLNIFEGGQELRQWGRELINQNKPSFYRNISTQYHDQFNLTPESLQSLSSTNPPHSLQSFHRDQPNPTKPDQQTVQAYQGKFGSADV